MVKKDSIFNRYVMRVIKLLYVLANIAIFSVSIYFFSFHNWNNFDKIFTDEQILWYSIILSVSYAIVLLALTRLYIAFRVGYMSKGNLIYCQTLSSLIAVVFAYFIFDCITLSFQNPLPFIGVLVVEFLLSFIWSVLATKLYFKITKPQNTVLIYRSANDLKRIEEAKQFAAYKIEKEIRISNESGKEIIEQLGHAEVVFVSGVDADVQNDIVTYCVENNIDCFLSLLIGNVIVSGGKHNQAFSTPIIGINRSSPSLEYLFIKRAFDIFVSILGIIIASPIMLITALAIKLYDRGPAIYKQERLTKDGKTFTLYKFRSMIADAEKDGVARLSTENDNRITPLGKVIRACRIDELPQLVNILKGDMTIVGPRPERPDIAQQYLKEIPEFNLRLQVKAGLTGYAQVYGKYNTNPYDKLGMDLMYINKMSVFTDLKIMFYTVRILLMKSSTSGIESGQTTAFTKEDENSRECTDLLDNGLVFMETEDDKETGKNTKTEELKNNAEMENNENENGILISVVMPAYNADSTIEESIQSVINQTYNNWELIVVNDCSRDKTVEKVKKFVLKDERIKLINLEKNGGVGQARNIGVDSANGNWIAFLDSDDLWTENKLSETIALINRTPEGKLFFTGSSFIGYDGKKSDYVLKVPEKIDFDELLKQNLISCSSVVVYKENLIHCRMPSGNLHEDFATWLSILKHEKYAYGVNEPLLIYRLSKNSKSGNKLKAAKMNWRTYRKVGVPFLKAIKSMIVYTWRSLKKYSSI